MIPISKPYLNDQETKAASLAILSGWVTQGPKVKEFELAFADYVGAPFACVVSSCTTALHLALLTVGVRPGDVVITVSHSFIATANAIRSCGAEPVFVDIDPETYNICPQKLKVFLDDQCFQSQDGLMYKDIARLSQGESPLVRIKDEFKGRVAAIVVVHQMGYPCDVGHIVQLARSLNIPVIEDAACALGSQINVNNVWEKIGKPHGDIACFSFHPRKIITTGDGGMLTTAHQGYDQKFRLLRQHGMSVSDLERNQSNRVVFESYVTSAYNYRMTDIQASIGIEQLKKLDGILNQYRQIMLWYRQELEGIPWGWLPQDRLTTMCNWQSVPFHVRPKAPVTRDSLMQLLLTHGVSSRRGIMNAHQEQPYLAQGWDLPESQRARDEVVLLPISYAMTHEDVCTVCNVIKGK